MGELGKTKKGRGGKNKKETRGKENTGEKGRKSEQMAVAGEDCGDV